MNKVNLQAFLKRYYYKGDSGRFYNAGRVCSDKALLEGIIEFDLSCTLDELKTLLRNSPDLWFKPSKKGAAALQKMEVYNSMAPDLPIKTMMSKGTIIYYKVAPTGYQKLSISATPAAMEQIYKMDKDVQQLVNKVYFEEGQYQNFSSIRSFLLEMDIFLAADFQKRLDKAPELITFDPSVPAFKVLDASLIKDGPTPNWDSFTQRLDDPELFMAWVWSVFEPSNKGRQALWLQGPGKDGKTSVSNAIVSFLGIDSCNVVQKGGYDSEYFMANAYGKRLTIYADCSNPDIVSSERFKNITGNDIASINQKYERVYSDNVYNKVLITSNKFPKINIQDKAQSSRLLLVKVYHYTASNSGDSAFEDNLKAEFPAFLNKCKQYYPRFFPTNSDIPIRGDDAVAPHMWTKIMKYCTSQETSLYGRFIKDYIIFDDGATTDINDLEFAFNNFLMHNFKNGSRYSLFNTFLLQLANYGSMEIEHEFDDNENIMSTKVIGVKLNKKEIKI